MRGLSMEIIPEELVEETWQEVAKFTPEKAYDEMMKVGKHQPYLLAFIMEFSEELEREAKELAIYLFFVVYRMFQKGSGKKIKRISGEEIMECYEGNEELMGNLEGVHEKFLDRIAKVQLSRQPYVMKYMMETIIEAPDEEEDSVKLSDNDIGFLFLLLKTVVDVLDRNG